MRADGFDTPFSFPDPDAWTDYARRWAIRLSLGPGSSVYEVGCGAGAFLLPLMQLGVRVGGCDLAPALVDLARRALDGSDLSVCEAATAPLSPRYDAVIAHGVFAYFPDHAYARRVLERMAEKSVATVAVMDLPDADREREEVQARMLAFGDEDAYKSAYEGLEQRAYDKDWFVGVLRDLGMENVALVDEPLPGRTGPPTRFSVVATR